MLSDDDWLKVVAISKTRGALMPDTYFPAQAKTLRWKGGVTRYFSHFPGEAPEGYTSPESPEHMAMKVAIYKRLLDMGIPAELEVGQDDWRADILVGKSAFAPSLAVEVQITPQSAQRTLERTEQRQRSGLPTLWVFGGSALTGHLPGDLIRNNPVFIADTPDKAADIVAAVCAGKAFYDDLSGYQQTPARPVALLVSCRCGERWLYPFGMILLANRISREMPPVFISCFRTFKAGESSSPSARLKSVEAYFDLYMPSFKRVAQNYRVGLGDPNEVQSCYGRFGKLSQRVRVWERSYHCPACALTPTALTRGVPAGVDLLRCPVPIAEEVDARTILQVAPGWRTTRQHGYVEAVMTEAEWKAKFIAPLRTALATR
ncbi:TPA: competence protein CoiA family protein [Pseudomonas aeruginosa]